MKKSIAAILLAAAIALPTPALAERPDHSEVRSAVLTLLYGARCKPLPSKLNVLSRYILNWAGSATANAMIAQIERETRHFSSADFCEKVFALWGEAMADGQ